MSKRDECHKLVDAVPDSGLDELEETLVDLIEFWKWRDEIATQPVKQQQVIKMKGVIVETVIRPPFQGIEDDCL